MSKLFSLAGIGLLAACIALATPSAGHAQGYGYGHAGYGPRYTPGYGGYTPGYGSHGSTYSPGSYGYGGYGYGRPAVVHPQYEHWTPGRGWHEHGHTHVPHRGHYHTRPY